ncbi:MAG: hypothetical protein K9J12_12310 [Melioribacteraceae bacterium]|nr:hypothetical protein [Melioribacteraceae bacterium]MCF8263064.1 hypothetical protein [Melioribacteraceae bacterium]
MKMHNQHWINQEKKFLKAIKNVEIPNSKLEKVDYVEIKSQQDLNNIPDGGGCYWIWTNEPVIHTLHKNSPPHELNSGQIIYNGIAKDDVKGRVFHHLFGFEDAGWSGISMDIYKNNSQSHRKKAMSASGKVPYILENKIIKRGNKKKNITKGDNVKVLSPIKTKTQLLTLNLSNDERDFINSTNHSKYYFRNGINIVENKHKNYSFKVFFITGLSSLYLEFIEKKWRENGLPRLCSYSTGR